MSETKHTPEQTPRKTGKPVFIYIMILFIVAFLMMALSSLMHQRSNTEALGKLQDSVTAMQQIQESQEKIIELQDALAKTEDQLSAAENLLEEKELQFEQDLSAAQEALTAAEKEAEALQMLYCLQQEYSSGDYTACKALIEKMESDGLTDCLSSVPIDTQNGVITAPFVRFQQLKEAALNKLAVTPAA